ncbi:tyrosine-type recombinase/integrase [Methanococcoides sp. FTZ1]|uniref:tyrosine-type recombinase/integrase n=1 Tax=Methanococcoides sp. FTZ1 TaxID=3439061 RepID=UPI003F87C035
MTFLSPEATRAICKYVKFRNTVPNYRGKVRDSVHEKRKIHRNNDYLFIKKIVPENYLETHNEELRKLDLMGLTDVYRTLATRAGKATPSGKWQVIRSHNMRKMFNSILYNAGADTFFVEFLMGHTIDETRAAYFRADKEKMKERYLRYVPYLTIQKEMDVSESPQFQEMKQENEALKAENVKNIVERSELQKVKAELERMKEHQAALSEILGKFQEDPEIMAKALSKARKE